LVYRLRCTQPLHVFRFRVAHSHGPLACHSCFSRHLREESLNTPLPAEQQRRRVRHGGRAAVAVLPQ
jgi:hypothetical protein